MGDANGPASEKILGLCRDGAVRLGIGPVGGVYLLAKLLELTLVAVVAPLAGGSFDHQEE